MSLNYFDKLIKLCKIENRKKHKKQKNILKNCSVLNKIHMYVHIVFGISSKQICKYVTEIHKLLYLTKVKNRENVYQTANKKNCV